VATHEMHPSLRLNRVYGMIPALDAHQHFWHYNVHDYPWIDESMAKLRVDYLPEQLHLEASTCGVIKSIAVQARQTMDETLWLLALASNKNEIAGVVGWADINSATFAKDLEWLTASPKLLGLRHVVQAEPAQFLERPSFNAGISLLAKTNLVYELLIRTEQLPEAIAFVDRHPHQRFIVDHGAKPPIRSKELQPWRTEISKLAQRDNVSCKLSGLVTEANWKNWSLDDLRPYLDTLLDAFGVNRLMAGSDWPVCLMASSYERWWSTLREYFSTCSEFEQHAVFHRSAETIYVLAPIG
jgi:L-fuconolactonase